MLTNIDNFAFINTKISAVPLTKKVFRFYKKISNIVRFNFQHPKKFLPFYIFNKSIFQHILIEIFLALVIRYLPQKKLLKSG